jgi:hypothetical protein
MRANSSTSDNLIAIMMLSWYNCEVESPPSVSTTEYLIMSLISLSVIDLRRTQYSVPTCTLNKSAPRTLALVLVCYKSKYRLL